MNRYAAAVSRHPLPAHAVGEVVGQVLDGLGGDDPDLLVCFASAHFVSALDDALRALVQLLHPRVMVGTTASGVLAGTQEVEDGPGFAVLAAHLPSARLEPVAFHVEDTPDGPVVLGWPEADDDADLLLLAADPFTFPTAAFLRRVDRDRPGLAVLGGLASGATRPGGNRLWVDTQVRREGAVGVLLHGVPLRTVVSQGCRPVGEPLVVTRGHHRFVEELAGRPALERLRELVARVDDADRALLRRSVHLGVVVDEHRTDFGPGDFLVRTIVGADRATGAIAVGDSVAVGQTVQFHVRDAAAADDELHRLLTGVRAEAAVMFTCNGRGRAHFGHPDHDVGVVAERLGPIPVAGMFCAGELGPVRSRNALHAFTATLALFG